jgi:hypothetical protein
VFDSEIIFDVRVTLTIRPRAVVAHCQALKIADEAGTVVESERQYEVYFDETGAERPFPEADLTERGKGKGKKGKGKAKSNAANETSENQHRDDQSPPRRDRTQSTRDRDRDRDRDRTWNRPAAEVRSPSRSPRRRVRTERTKRRDAVEDIDRDRDRDRRLVVPAERQMSTSASSNASVSVSITELNSIIEGLDRAAKASDHLRQFCEHAATCFKAETEAISQAKFGLERFSLDEHVSKLKRLEEAIVTPF